MKRVERILGLRERLEQLSCQVLRDCRPYEPVGRVVQVQGTVVHATAPSIGIGDVVEFGDVPAERSLRGECIGFRDGVALFLTYGDLAGIGPDTVVRRSRSVQRVPVGFGLLGRVLDAQANFIDGLAAPFQPEDWYPLMNTPPASMSRPVINRIQATGVRTIDTLLTCGEGQRSGIFAAAGTGKSTLLSMIARGSAADVVVLALIGERGREVQEFLQRGIGPEAAKKCVTIVSTSDRSALERVRAAHMATAVAEFFRDKGQKVLFLMDSVTRFARALREIGLAAGEPPSRRGFPPSVFAALPKLLERSGMGEACAHESGSITAFYSVLVEGDDMNEPVADEVRSLLDGHIILSRDLANAGHFPAIDVLDSSSRLMPAIVSPEHVAMAARLRGWLASYRQVEFLLKVGEYERGSDKDADLAIARMPEINKALRQSPDMPETFESAIDALAWITR